MARFFGFFGVSIAKRTVYPSKFICYLGCEDKKVNVSPVCDSVRWRVPVTVETYPEPSA